MLADPHAGHFFSVLVGMCSGMATSPSLHADPRCPAGERKTPTGMLAFLSRGCCAPARMPLGTTRLPDGLPPRLPNGPGFAPHSTHAPLAEADVVKVRKQASQARRTSPLRDF